MSTASPYQGHRLAGLYPLSGLLEQALIMPVQGHVAVTVIHDQQQTIAS